MKVAVNIACGVLAVVLLLLLGQITGRISVNRGYGFDGEHYARMIERGFEEGTPGMRLRPVVLLINDEVNYHVFHNPLTTFRAMNVVYAFALAVILADLCQRYGASPVATAIFVLNLFLCISIAKMFAFYPTLIDLGAYAFMAASVWAILAGHRLLIVVTSILAVLSREFAAVNVLFGIIRDLRTGRSLPTVAATYAPAVVAFFAIRRFAAGYVQGTESGEPVFSVGGLVAALLQNTAWWSDPAYAVLWLYFAATLFGGISLFLLTASRPILLRLRNEPEWLAIVMPILAVTVLGYTDMWRYGAFVVPVLPVFWAWGVAGVKPGRAQLLLFMAVFAATVATQRPWQHMDMDAYFRDWFPYYVVLENRAAAPAALWPVWRNYLAVAVVSLVALVLVRQRAERVIQDGKPNER
jgi:hypothetical protein